jgi:hypothetical protein
MNKQIWVFLSHSNKDYDRVKEVRNMLESMSFRPIMFYLLCLSDNDEVDNLIKREIDARTRFIYCDSENHILRSFTLEDQVFSKILLQVKIQMSHMFLHDFCPVA